jgi:NADPH:quinone reductase-like Zn-dependent oxidoreductase
MILRSGGRQKSHRKQQSRQDHVAHVDVVVDFVGGSYLDRNLRALSQAAGLYT